MSKTKKDFVIFLSIVLIAVTLAISVLHTMGDANQNDDEGCGRSIPPACAEMGKCVYNFKECRYEEVK